MIDHTTERQIAFRDALVDAQLLRPTAVEGLYLRSATYESVLGGVHRVITAGGAPEHPTVVHAPLLVPQRLLEQTDYVRSFPDLLGTVRTFTGDQSTFIDVLSDLDHGADWTAHLENSSLAVASAACHSLYPLLASPLPAAGSYYEVFGQCFRHEPSPDPFRQLAFHMHEQVFVGSESAANEYWLKWIDRGTELFHGLGLAVEPVVANDPFFGRSGMMLAENQRAEALKIEFVLPIYSDEAPTAITSVNRHRTHFGDAFDLRTDDGEVAHSSCVGCGVDRIALALFFVHGLAPETWPVSVRAQLDL